MIEAIGAVRASPTLDTSRAAMPELSQGATEVPNPHQVADFAKAAASRPMSEMQAAPPTARDALSTRLGHQADAISTRLKEMDFLSDPASPNGAGQTSGVANDELDRSLAQLKRVFAFSLESTLVSQGSTESTKVFNSLLKGQ